jgi:hypothetical protein
MRIFVHALVLVSLLVCGCDALRSLHEDHTGGHGAPPPSPRVRLVETRLAHHPSDQQLAVHYCTQVAAGSRLGPAGVLLCRALGPTPSTEDLQFRWEIELEATNPSSVPVPLVQALVAFTAFPGEADPESLGAICLTLCESGDTCPQSEEATSCQSDEPAITDLESLGHAAAGFLTSVALGEDRFEDLTVRTIAPHGTVRFVAELAFDVEPMLGLIERSSESAVTQAREGHAPEFVIPYAVEGSIWVEARNFGRIAASFPRTEGRWDLAATATD